ncbi:MAG: hypothetical protein P1U44_13230 [Vicingaceae bacterium]|nr:hypothetical protein [Vicingaceae bacterium]
MATEKKGKYEKLAWFLIFVGLAFTIMTTILFFINRSYSKDQPIDSAVFGQYGDIIGGLVGTVVALVSFLLLYETLNEQRRQFSQQQADTQAALKEQNLQFKRQSEDEIFYRVLDKQQNRIINSTLTSYSGYQIFTYLTDLIKNRMLDSCHLLARKLICDDPNGIDDLFLIKLFMAHDSRFLPNQLEDKKEKFITQLLNRDKNDRWEYIKRYFGSVGHEPPNMRSVLQDIGSVNFYKINFEKRQGIYQNVFSTMTNDFGFFLDSYLKEIEFISQLIENAINEKVYSDYFISQTTKYECVIIFYYLLSGQATPKFSRFIKRSGLFSTLHYYSSLMIDLPSEKDIMIEIQNIDNLYADKQ